MVNNNFLLIAYDVAATRRRNKIAKILEAYGTRVNYSVFECLLTTSRAETMKNELARYIKTGKDTILVYTLCKSCVNKRITIKGKNETVEIVKVL